ncbi:hypothetical protein [Variovorax sp. V15]|uniref:hypothetical protein n=1 Tax=Variovorax sp. V15 TaxID=3065952 RepID=UPI0034E8AF8C
MGHQTVVYGSIEVFQSSDVPGADARTDEALMRLPEIDEWPFLTRSMFSVTPPGYGPHGSYLYRVISFGASYKAVEWEWAEWLLKFERLLALLDFTYARVHLETELVGKHTYIWDGHSDDGKKISPDHWQFSGGPRTFSD